LKNTKYGGNLFIFRMAGVIQVAWTLSGLNYGTREPAWWCKEKCTTGTTWRQNIKASCRGGLTRSSDEVPVMGMEQRG